VLTSTGCRVVDLELAVPLAADAFDDHGALRSSELDARARELLDALASEVEAGRRLRVAA
jgi:hypothetical protein